MGDVVELLFPGNVRRALVVKDVEPGFKVAGFIIDDSPNSPFVRGIEQGPGVGQYTKK